jgi:hypothetical protein
MIHKEVKSLSDQMMVDSFQIEVAEEQRLKGCVRISG